MIQTIKDLVSAKADTTVALAREIWGYAELSYEESKSAAALIAALKQEGFTIEEGIADIPTAFTATYQCGSGKPVVGFLAEYDALSGLSQKADCPVQEPVREGGAGHGCGHNLLGAGCYAAAVALKDYLIKEKKDGTVIFFGCPAEEGAGSKQFIARAGYFDNVDFAYTWHPETVNEVSSRGSVAIMGANFTFDGVAAHAGGEPHLGRSGPGSIPTATAPSPTPSSPGTCAWRTWTSATSRARRSSTMSPSTPNPGKRWPLWAPPARARPPLQTSSTAFMTLPTVKSATTASTSTRSERATCAAAWASSSRT